MAHIEDRLRTFAKLLTQNFDLKVYFVGETPSITTNEMFIPPLKDTQEAFKSAKCMVAHESGHDLFSVMDLKDKASKECVWIGDILNCLEDARIEIKMCKQFEGLKADFDTEVKKITDQMNIYTLPLHKQVLHGMYLRGKEFDTDFLTKKAQKILDSLSSKIQDAVSQKDSLGVLDISREIFSLIEDIFPDINNNQSQDKRNTSQSKSSSDFKTISDISKDKLEEHKIEGEGFLDPEYDRGLIDGAIPEEETIREIDKGSKSFYQKLIQPYIQQLSFLIQHIRNLVEKKRTKKRKRSTQRGKKAGVIDIRSVWKIATDETDIFKRRQKNTAKSLDVDPDSLVFYILLDISSSMTLSVNRIEPAKEAVAVFGEVLNRLDISFAITAYSAGTDKLVRIPIKRFNEEYNRVKTKIAKLKIISGTYTSEQIPFAQRRLKERTERKKVLIIVSDADAIESEYRLNRAIQKLSSDGIYPVGIGISTDAMSDYFDRYIEIDDLSNFGKELLSVLRDILR